MYSKTVLIGNLGGPPEVRKLESGKAVGKFSLATSKSYKDKEGAWQEQTTWHHIVVWEQRAEFAEKHLKKGMKVLVEGEITYREYTDKDNVKRFITEIVASELKVLEGPKKEEPKYEGDNGPEKEDPREVGEGGEQVNPGLPF